MITAIDTNVLLDILIPGAAHAQESAAALARASEAGALVISEPVYSELAARFPARAEFDEFLESTGIELERSSAVALHEAGRTWSAYVTRRGSGLICNRCGRRQRPLCANCSAALQSRQHLIADFAIAAHAASHADRLLTRDHGFYKTYFPRLPRS